MQYKYLDETRQFGRGRIGWMVRTPRESRGRCRESPSRSTRCSRIRRHETKSASEKTWVGDFAKQVGNIGLMLSAVAFAVFFTMLLVAANTMAQSVRERTNEIGVLKTLGFTHAAVTWLVLIESLLLTVDRRRGRSRARVAPHARPCKPCLNRCCRCSSCLGTRCCSASGLRCCSVWLAGALPAARAMRLGVVEALRGG